MNFVIVEEISNALGPEVKQRPGKGTYRFLADEENVYKAQHVWHSNAGQFVLTPRYKVCDNQVNIQIVAKC